MSTGTQIQIADGIGDTVNPHTGNPYGIITGKQVETKINAVFEEMESWSRDYPELENYIGQFIEYANYAKNNVKVIRIIPGWDDIKDVKKENGQWIIEASIAAFNHPDFVSFVATSFYNFAIDNM